MSSITIELLVLGVIKQVNMWFITLEMYYSMYVLLAVYRIF
jgi:hypothetical protein